MSNFAKHAERVTHFGIAVTAGLLALTACTPQVDRDVQVNDCTVSVATQYVTQYGPLDEVTWAALREECTRQVERGEWP
ncbi:hypothetical protein DBR36_14180 [Microbacterium sp. HMWF026]|uniref:hypothetical protein n=1 Tax=Microbacterium sp. HMWF026 TaxID=2056861 RepID=UPI000D3531BE|nr:hypothetical protein [Microbacterium sp. HMWF026]PTT15804.1 hypothetical protein DBR36_14180 [Microbacterium sp. HMWF026]